MHIMSFLLLCPLSWSSFYEKRANMEVNGVLNTWDFGVSCGTWKWDSRC